MRKSSANAGSSCQEESTPLAVAPPIRGGFKNKIARCSNGRRQRHRQSQSLVPSLKNKDSAAQSGLPRPPGVMLICHLDVLQVGQLPVAQDGFPDQLPNRAAVIGVRKPDPSHWESKVKLFITWRGHWLHPLVVLDAVLDKWL